MTDFQTHKDFIAKHTTHINEAALQGMIKNYALVMSQQDARYVACSDDSEKKTVRENFLKKKLELTHSDAELDAAIDEVCHKLQETRLKSRIAFYYLLAEKYEKLEQFA